VALVRVYCGLASADLDVRQEATGPWLTIAVVDDAGRLLDICDLSDDAAGYAQLGALLAERSSGPASVAVAADTDDHLVTQLLTAAGRYLAYTDEDSAEDYAERFGDDDSIEEIQSNPAERRAIGLARALQAGVLSAVPQPTPRDLISLKPVLTAHAAVTSGRQGAAGTLREVLRELYPAALRAFPDPAEPLPLAILEALPEPGLLGPTGNGRSRDAQVVADLTAAGAGDGAAVGEAVTALRVAIAETPRRTGMNRTVTSAVAETIRQSVAAVRACDAAAGALVGVLDERMGAGRGRSQPRRDTAAPAQLRAVPAPAADPILAPTPMPVAPVSLAPPPVPPMVQPPAPPPVAPAPAPVAPRPTPVVPAAAAPPPAFPPPPDTVAPAAVQPPPPPGITPILPRRDMRMPASPMQASPVHTNPMPTSPAAGPRPPIIAQPVPAPQPVVAPVSASPVSPAASRPLAPPPVGPPTLDPPTFPGFERTGDLPLYSSPQYVNEPPAPRLSPDITPGSRTNWPLVTDPLREPVEAYLAEPLDVTITSYPRFDLSEPLGSLRSADAPRPQEGRIKPPWQADDLPAEPPVLRLVESSSLDDPAPEPLTFDLAYSDGDYRGESYRGESYRGGGHRSEGHRSDSYQGDTYRGDGYHGDSYQDEFDADPLFAPPDLRLVESDDGERSWRDTGSWRTLEEVSRPVSLAPISLAPSNSEESDGDLLIFAATRSAWFTDHVEPDAGDVDWTTPADLGWRAAEQAARPVVGADTTSGLPRRVPQQNLVPGSPISAPAERPLRIVRDPESIAAHTNGYFQGWRSGRQVGGYAVGGRPGRESAGGWDFSRDNNSPREYQDRDYEYRTARR
jgi:hypothetical protein